MPRLIDSESRTEALTAAVTDVLAREGTPALSLRRLAEVSGVSTSSMLHHYGSREHLFRVLAWRSGKARLADVNERRYYEKVGAFLPAGADALALATTWQAWVELSRCEPAWQRTVDELLEHEHGMLAVELELRYDDDRVTAVAALIAGLIGAMGRRSSPMEPADARRILDLAVTQLLAPAH